GDERPVLGPDAGVCEGSHAGGGVARPRRGFPAAAAHLPEPLELGGRLPSRRFGLDRRRGAFRQLAPDVRAEASPGSADLSLLVAPEADDEGLTRAGGGHVEKPLVLAVEEVLLARGLILPVEGPRDLLDARKRAAVLRDEDMRLGRI